MDTPLRALHEALRAQFSRYFDVALPAAYDALETEWPRAREMVALFDTNYHAVFELSGPDRARYLNAVTTGDVRGLSVGRGVPGLLLNAQGHILAELDTLALDDRFLLLSHAMVANRSLETLDKYIIMDDCTLTDVSGQWSSLALEGPRAGEALATTCSVTLDGMPLFAHQEAVIAGAKCLILRRSHFDFPAAEIFVPRDAALPVWQALLDAARAAQGGPIGWDAINALRIEAGMRWFGAEFDDTVLPHEAGLGETHISYTKGCYTGQEIVERVRSRGKLNRWLVLLEFSGQAPPAPGAKLDVEGKSWGHVTSCAYSPARKSYIGFGYLRREHNSVGEVLQCANCTARVLASPAEPPKSYFRPAACS